ncbi:hypothetical protein XacyCFBP2565_22180 [Xanthomonas arboricola pv. corylina]|nr:hypothetical protein XacyCFBP2565_22180 [Xanthomonas arboricola pv. corylina]
MAMMVTPTMKVDRMSQSTGEFQEIAHSGGKLVVRVRTNDSGGKSYQLHWSSSRPNPSTLIQLFALPQGIPLEPISAVGIGVPIPAPSVLGAYMVMVASDSTGKFGHHCPVCREYWRSEPWPWTCPYCRVEVPSLDFLSDAQRAYVDQFCRALMNALDADNDCDIEIDMDKVADAVGSSTPKPAFYVSEQSQQHQFRCVACGTFNDILGTYGYCSGCGTRNDLAVFEKETVPEIRKALNGGGRPENAIRDSVAAFDSFVGQYAKQLAKLVPLTTGRKDRLEKRFHDFRGTLALFREIFDIDLAKGLKPADIDFLALGFHRRHVFEHKGGEADEHYLATSGDTSVKLKQTIRETQDGAHELLGLLVRAANNLHKGFHSLIPVRAELIESHATRVSQRRSPG